MLAISAVATWGMAGVIWLVQIVHYPLLGRLSQFEPITAVVEHQRRIVAIVGPLMFAEGVTALWLLWRRPATMSAVSAWVAAGLLGVALLSTIAIQVPHHRELALGHNGEVVHSLIAGNWIRTIAWTARGVLLAFVLATPTP